MSLDFKPRSESSFDQGSRVSIPQPRMLPAILPDGESGTEYQYAFYRDGLRIGGLGFHGSDRIVKTERGPEWVFTFDLGYDALVESMLRFQQDLGNTDDKFTFLCGLAYGLVAAYMGRTDNEDDLRYVAVTTVDALARAGVMVPDGAIRLVGDQVVLAEARVPAKAD